MDFFGITRGSIRGAALEKLALLSVESPSDLVINGLANGVNGVPYPNEGFESENDDFYKILSGVRSADISSIPMSLKEFEILVALSHSTLKMRSIQQASILLERLGSYFMELPTQRFTNHVLMNVSPSPWNVLSHALTSAVARIGKLFPSLFPSSKNLLLGFIDSFASESKSFSNYASLLGFLDALADEPKLLTTFEGFECFLKVHGLLGPIFLNHVETYTSDVFPQAHEYQYFGRNSFSDEFSALLYLKSFNRLIVSMVNSIVDNRSRDTLIEFLVSKSSELHDRIVVNNPDYALEGCLEHQYDKSDVDNLLISDIELTIIKDLADIAAKSTNVLDSGEPYIVYSTYERLHLGHTIKALALEVIGAGIFTDKFSVTEGHEIFKNNSSNIPAMLHRDLGPTLIHFGAVLTFKDHSIGGMLARTFTSIFPDPSLNHTFPERASKSVALACKCLSQDAVVTTIYALTNLLAVDSDGAPRRPRTTLTANSLSVLDTVTSSSSNDNNPPIRTVSTASKHDSVHDLDEYVNSMSLSKSGPDNARRHDQENLQVFRNAITAVAEIVKWYDDPSVSTLAVTILSQKLRKSSEDLDFILLEGLALCAPYVSEREFLILLKLFNGIAFQALKDDHVNLVEAVINARVIISHILRRNDPHFEIYLHEILNSIISKGDIQVLEHHRPHNEISEIGRQISIFLRPLAELLPPVHEKPIEFTNSVTVNLFKDIWFNMVVHGYSDVAPLSKLHRIELERIAHNSPPLASEFSWNRTETSIELNTVLRRGSSNHNLKDHKLIMGDIIDINSLELRTMSYPKLMFLSATVFLETLRVRSGNCSKVLLYFSDPSVKTTGVDKYLGHIAFAMLKQYITLVNFGGKQQFVAELVAEQLTDLLILCCHRLSDLQDAAFQCCDLLIAKIPSALCHHKSLFTLLDLLTLLFESVVDMDINQYEPRTAFRAERTGVQLLLTDSQAWRHNSLELLQRKATEWVKSVLLKCDLDMKSLFQAYVSEVGQFQRMNKVEFGVSFALDMAGSILSNDRELSHVTPSSERFDTLSGFLSQFSWRSSFRDDIMNKISSRNEILDANKFFIDARNKVADLKAKVKLTGNASEKMVVGALEACAGLLIISLDNNAEIVRHIVNIPFLIFSSQNIQIGISIWLTVMKERPDLSVLLLSEIAKRAELSIKNRQGLFSVAHDLKVPEFLRMEYAPSDKVGVNRLAYATSKSLQPHLDLIRFFSSHFQATLHQSDHLLKMFTRVAFIGLKNLSEASLHPFSRLPRFEFIRFAIDILNYHVKLGSRIIPTLTDAILDAGLSWFRKRASYPFGANMLKIKADYDLLSDVTRRLTYIKAYGSTTTEIKKSILTYFLDNEISTMGSWLTPLDPQESRGKYLKSPIDEQKIRNAYTIDPILAINLALRYKIKHLDQLLKALLIEKPLPAIRYPDAVQYYVGIDNATPSPNHYLLYWKPLSPVDAITLFLPPFNNDPYILQYTMRSLEKHDVNLTFFYVPQIVQSLRYDSKGYVERFILETAKVSQLFSHQIIWNMLANSYKDEDSTIPDEIKPNLDRIQQQMIDSFTPQNLEFYRNEFGFFNEVTSISGKLKPYIKKTKAEKKLKIDEEMAQISIKSGVYLPSNPDGVVIDINRTSGKPLQSHAKAPFMASFKIRKNVSELDMNGSTITREIEKWQGAIFKVGDDCRQDVLALQLISVFRTIWSYCGLDLYVFPYRVTATAPGCGVIDVLPNSVSRDMLGREAVNGLYEYFTTKFGPPHTIEFQEARNNFIKSLAAYSIISYLIQFKDRHNGNIMYDDQGHILHIDFGFCFDIVPGGVKFEAAPFKLTHEMILVMGGSADTQAYRWFEELCIKGYLACRPYMETIVRCVTPMLDSGLPCFKEKTIKNLRSRFVPNKTEKEAASFMRGLIRKSMESFYTKGYDEFQRITNGIPY